MAAPASAAPGGLHIDAASAAAESIAAAGGFPATWTWRSVRALLLSDSPITSHLRLHIAAIRTQPDLYCGLVRHMVQQQVHLGWTTVGKARVLAAALSVKSKGLAIELLKTDLFGLAEVLRAVQWLDSARALRQLRAKVATVEAAGGAAVQRGPEAVKKHESALAKLQTMLAQLEADTQLSNDDPAYRVPARGKGRRARPAAPGGASFSGNKARLIRKWAGAFPPHTLSFFLLNFPKEPWRLLADLVHFKPKDFTLPFFLASIYDAPAPEGSMVHLASTATRATLASCLEAEHGLAACYSFFRAHFKDARTRVAEVDASVAEIIAMGFTRKAALLARQHHPAAGPAAVEQCVEWILEHSLHIEAAANPADPAVAEGDLTAESKALFGQWAPLVDLLWFWEELESPAVEASVHARLTAGEQLDATSSRANFGKLLERILLLRKKNVTFWPLLVPLADQRLQVLIQTKQKIAAGVASTSEASSVAALTSSMASAAIAPVNPIALLAEAAATPATGTTASTGSRDGSKSSAARVAVFGDASGSMEVAIQSASSLGALLAAVFSAELSFFNSRSFLPPVQPRTATDTLRVIDATLARDNTSMAAALWPYYTEKKKLDLVLLVSDEGENAAAPNGMMFAQLWRAYLAEVHPESKLFLISFLPNDPSIVGTIKQRLDAIGLGADVPQFRFDLNRPDTSKFDQLLGILSLDIELIHQRQNEVKQALQQIPNVLLDIVAEY